MAMAPAERAPTGHVVLDIGQDIGALVVYTRPELCGREIEVSPKGNAARRTHTEVLERRANGRAIYAAVFPTLVAGDYSLWRDVLTDEDVTIAGGAVAEVDWHDVVDPSAFRLAQPERRAPGATPAAPPPPAPPGVLPARYRQGQPVSAAPMGAAPMCYDADGAVAWDQMWSGFCDLALAGGPRHRETLLEPPTPQEVDAAREEYERVVAEIERGFRLVTALPTVRSTVPGWVGLQCDDEAMARWLLRAIAEENVSVRREGCTLFLPAAPSFRLDTTGRNTAPSRHS